MNDQVGVVRTVTGDISPAELGFTLPHEHVLVDIIAPALRGRPELDIPIELSNRYRVDYGRAPSTRNFLLDDDALMIAELEAYKQAGGHGLVELSVGGLSPQPRRLAEIARRTELAIVLGCGWYVENFLDDEVGNRSVDDLAAEMIASVREGVWGTDVRAGIIGEIGCSVPWTKLERRVMTAAVLAQQETGAALTIHPGAAVDAPLEIVDFLRTAGADLERTVIDHIDRTLFALDDMLRLAETGVVLEFDLFGCESAYWPLADIDMPNDGQRIEFVAGLVKAGHGQQILCSQDICRLTRLCRFGGHGYAHMLDNVVPLMRARGLDEAIIETIFQATPRRLLTII